LSFPQIVSNKGIINKYFSIKSFRIFTDKIIGKLSREKRNNFNKKVEERDGERGKWRKKDEAITFFSFSRYWRAISIKLLHYLTQDIERTLS